MALVLLGLACQRLPATKTASLPPESAYIVDQYVTQVKLDSTRLIATVVLSELAVPWEITWGSDGWLWFAEQRGTVNRLNPAPAKASSADADRRTTSSPVRFRPSQKRTG